MQFNFENITLMTDFRLRDIENSFFYLLLLFFYNVFSQENSKSINYLDFQLFRGSIIKHADYVSHLTLGHPSGLLLSYNWKTFGEKEWHQVYNYPDYGISYHFNDFDNNILGSTHSLGAHFNFYFVKRSLLLRISQGITYATDPYHREHNNKNNAFGSKILNNNFALIQYQKQDILGKIGIQAGLMFNHFSNGRFKSPNSGINTYQFILGLNYKFDENREYKKDSIFSNLNYREKIKYNFAFRTGKSEGPVPEMASRQFYHFGFYIDKRISRKSALQLGTDIFFSRYLKDYIDFVSVSYPNNHPEYTSPETDYRRLGLFVGHELFINRLSLETQLGVYVYKPFKYETDVYQRIGLKYYFYNNIFTGVGLKAHGAKAEAIEATLGIRI